MALSFDHDPLCSDSSDDSTYDGSDEETTFEEESSTDETDSDTGTDDEWEEDDNEDLPITRDAGKLASSLSASLSSGKYLHFMAPRVHRIAWTLSSILH